MKKITTKTNEVSLDSNGIIHKKVIEGAHLDRQHIIESEKICEELAGSKKFLLFIDAMSLHTMTPEAVDELKKSHNTRVATAIFSKSTAIRILADHLGKEEKIPIKLFPDKEQALQWLLTFKKK